jgi:hypothetical protein
MPDISSIAPADVNQWIVFDVHKTHWWPACCRRRAARLG